MKINKKTMLIEELTDQEAEEIRLTVEELHILSVRVDEIISAVNLCIAGYDDDVIENLYLELSAICEKLSLSLEEALLWEDI
jgi:hypothetical protein